MNRPLFRARNLDPSKRIRLFVDQHDDNNNTLTNSSTSTTTTTTQSSSSNNLLVSFSSTSNLQASQQTLLSNSQLPQRCVPQMPFVSGMEREEESEYHLQNALDAQRRLGSAKIRAVPIPDLYEDPNSQSIYPAINQLPKQLIRLQPLQLESDEPEYDMDRIDHNWFNEYGRISCPNLTYLEYEIIIDKLENASTRTLISFDEARTLLSNIDESHLKNVYDFWHKRRTTRDKRLKPRLLTERDIKEEKGKHHPYVAFRRRVEKMTTRKNRKNDEQAYLSMLKLRSNFEAVVKLTSLIKVRETTKASLIECALSIFQARCESKPDDETSSTTTSPTNTSITLPTNHDRHSHHHARSNLKTSSLLNSNSSLTATQHQQLLTQLIRMENHKKNPLSSSTLASLLQTPIQSQQIRSLSNDSNDCLQPKLKRFKASDSSVNNNTISSKKLFRKLNHTDKLTQLLSSPTTSSSPIVHNLALSPSTSIPQSILERLSPGNIFSPQLQQQQQSQQQSGRRRSKNSLSGAIKQGKNHRNLPLADLWSLTENSSSGTILLKAQLLEAAKKLQQKEELENNTNRRVILQDGSSILSNSNENINNSFDGVGTSIDDEESIDPWQFRPKAGCRYLRPIDQDQQQHTLPRRSTFSSFYYVACSERGHIGKRRVRLGRGGRLLYDRHIEQENKDLTDETFLSSHITDKPVLWRLSSRPLLKESYRLHSYLTVNDHTMSLAHHYQSKSSKNSSIYLNNSSYDINSSLSLNTTGKNLPSSSIELDHPYSCSSRRISQALSTLTEPQPPSPSSPPPLSSSNTICASQQMMLISTPPTPPPSTTTNNHDIDISQQEQSEQHQQQLYTKSSSTYVLSPTTPVFPSHHPSYVIPSTPPPPPPLSSSVPTKQTPSSCGLVQLVQLHRIHPPTKTHKFASSTPVTTSDS
ncbi:unnamed protein product [Rotaria sp. Silwood2]|nr:unnamed protein product [Rotaria sp. Silwood2]CAF2498643.1 unnamed protein product [Rotaria sp. Silwood2]CAF2728515.1 unnamed protein product [Rotaria sp. Silwood2]CAF2896194.1 unnamed protein product [Rotaria sp. Silwood2]